MIKDIPLSPSRMESTNFLIENLQKILSPNSEIIDIGCGKLYFYEILKKLDIKGLYTGIDLNPNKINSNRKLKTKIIKRDFFSYNSNKKYDLAVCLWVLEHVKDDRQFLNKIHNILKRKAFLILAVPSIWSWPFEFGRHGYHYYTWGNLHKLLKYYKFEIVKFRESGGFLGFIFMIIYNWLRFLILLIIIPEFLIIKIFFRNIKWRPFSSQIIKKTLYFYHGTKLGIELHNNLVQKIVHFDKKFRILPVSYILIMQKT